MRKLNQRGDTIIEVLVSLAVLAFVLTLAYAITNRSLAAVRASQERIEALKLAEGQIEIIKSISADATSNNLPVEATFCFEQGVLQTNLDNCRSIGPSDLYSISVSGPGNASGGLYIVNVSWNRFGGGNQQEVLKLEYKAYDGVGQAR